VIARFVAVGPGAATSARIRSGTRLPDAAIDLRNGELYLVWEDSRFTRRRKDTIALSESRDGGLHWSSPRKIPSSAGAAALTPAVAVDANGRVGVSYYTLSVDKRTGALPSRFWFTSSRPGGTSFGSPVALSRTFDMLSAPYSEGFFLGDYEGLAAAGDAFVSLHVVANTGNLNNRTDVYAAVLRL
jgi:hypothetical protein